MAMETTKAASAASDARLRAALEAGDTASVQLGTGTGIDINKQRNQVARLGFGKAGSARS